MKNQYFGDINDYKKYSLLRHLSANGSYNTAVCWVLTQDDNGTNGNKTKYLAQPDVWHKYDPIVFSHLREHVHFKDTRNVEIIKELDALSRCHFFDDFIHDNAQQREQYFQRFFQFAKGADLVFFDPDIGLECKSVPLGKKRSSMYIYLAEIKQTFDNGHSVLFYQHFPRKPREQYINELVRKLGDLGGVQTIFSFSTFNVAFILIPQPDHEVLFKENIQLIATTWGEIITTKEFRLQQKPYIKCKTICEVIR